MTDMLWGIAQFMGLVAAIIIGAGVVIDIVDKGGGDPRIWLERRTAIRRRARRVSQLIESGMTEGVEEVCVSQEARSQYDMDQKTIHEVLRAR